MDGRKQPRFPVQFRSSFSSTNMVSGIGILEDLSIRGCRIFSATHVRPGTDVELRVETPNDGPPIQIRQAVVRWSRGSNFGLEFITIADHEWTRLQQIVKNLERHPFQREHKIDETTEESD